MSPSYIAAYSETCAAIGVWYAIVGELLMDNNAKCASNLALHVSLDLMQHFKERRRMHSKSLILEDALWYIMCNFSFTVSHVTGGGLPLLCRKGKYVQWNLSISL